MPKKYGLSLKPLLVLVIGLFAVGGVKAEEVTKTKIMCWGPTAPFQTTLMTCHVGEQQAGIKKAIWEYYKSGFYVTAAYYDPQTENHFVFLQKE